MEPKIKVELGRISNFLKDVTELTSDEVKSILAYTMSLVDSGKEKVSETIKERRERFGIDKIISKYKK